MVDRIGVARYPVDVTPVSGAALDDLNNRLHTMETELRHLLTAVADMKNGLSAKNSRLLTSGVMNSRNWTLSVVMSHCYLQTLLGANPGQGASNSALMAKFQLYDMFKRAAETGASDGIATRQRLGVRPSDIGAQVNWDGKIVR